MAIFIVFKHILQNHIPEKLHQFTFLPSECLKGAFPPRERRQEGICCKCQKLHRTLNKFLFLFLDSIFF